jgi:hypothetical protein
MALRSREGWTTRPSLDRSPTDRSPTARMVSRTGGRRTAHPPLLSLVNGLLAVIVGWLLVAEPTR